MEMATKTGCYSPFASSKIHEASVKSYHRPFECRCHAAHAAHDWQHGIIHVHHHASHAGDDSAHVRSRLPNTIRLQEYSSHIRTAYGAVEPVVVREDGRNIHVPGHATTGYKYTVSYCVHR